MFDRLATVTSDAMGRSGVFAAALAFVLAWALSGPLFGFSDTWQLVINTSTTVVTFLMIFLVQHSQNEDTKELKAALSAIVDRFNLEAEKEAIRDDL